MKVGFSARKVFRSPWTRSNNTRDSNATTSGNGGGANNPNGEPGDTGFQLSQTQMTIHRDIRTNIIPRVTPTPGPVPNKFDWGFEADTTYGRDGQPCRMNGWDTHWSINEPGATNAPVAASTRQGFLCTPNIFAQVYLPFWKGMALTAGRMGDVVGMEIPPPVRPGPTFFWSHSYAFYAETWQVWGILGSVNVYRSPKNGYVAAEFGVNAGEQSYQEYSGNPGFSGAVHYRSPHMNTWIDYTFRMFDGNLKLNSTGNLVTQGLDYGVGSGGVASPGTISPLYPLQAMNGQRKMRNSWTVQHEIGKRWKVTAEGVYGFQHGDGAATTVLSGPAALGYCGGITTPGGIAPACPGFKGASYSGVNGNVFYTINKKATWGLRVEHFNDPDGVFLAPLNYSGFYPSTVAGPMPASVKTALNDITFGINYNPVKFVRLRPEIRYDWQSGNHGVPIFGAGNLDGKMSQTQIMASMDAVFYF